MKSVEKIINELNLEAIIVKAIDSDEGLGWNFPHACRVAEEYRRFLTLCLKYPDEAIVPSNVVDDFWHLHILDTQKYAADCEHYLGYFLHHFPYFGMRGEKDANNLRQSWENTKTLYTFVFGEAPPADLWPNCNRCPNCGRRVNDSIAMMQRPMLADFGLKV